MEIEATGRSPEREKRRKNLWSERLKTLGWRWLPVLIAIGGITVSYQILKNQEDHFAWQTISSQKPGNSGLGEALKRLKEQDDVSLNYTVLGPSTWIRDAKAEERSRIPKAYIGKVDLEEIDLSHSWLGYTDFSEARMNRAKLRWTTLDETNFTGTQLEKAELREAEGVKTVLNRVNMKKAVAPGIKLYEAVALDAEFDGSDLRDSVLRGITALGASFKKTNLQKAKLINAHIQRAEFNYAEMKEADLTGAGAEHAVFKGADLTKAMLSKANLEDADLKWTCFADAVLKNAQLHRANAEVANFAGANLEGASINKVSFKGSNISQIKVSGAIGLSDAVWEGTWIWSGQKPEVRNLSPAEETAWKEVISKLIVYKEDCRNEWIGRIERERKNRDEEIAMSLYRPPERSSCRIVPKLAP